MPQQPRSASRTEPTVLRESPKQPEVLEVTSHTQLLHPLRLDPIPLVEDIPKSGQLVDQPRE